MPDNNKQGLRLAIPMGAAAVVGLLLLSAVFSGGVGAQVEEEEPNDNQDQAMPISVSPESATQVNANLLLGEEDWYAFELQEGDFISINPGGPWYAELRGPDGDVIAADDPPAGRLQATVSQAGTHYIRLWPPAAANGDYTLTITLQRDDTQDVDGSDESTFKVMATTDGDVSYRFTVDGAVSKTVADDGTAADDDDRITGNDDGTTTVVGSTGDRAGDAYLIAGRVTEFERTGGESLYRLYLDGEEVTEELTPGSTFEIVSTDSDSEFSYEFTADGEVHRMVSESGHAGDSSDEITEGDDGMVTVRGSTGFGDGDAFAVNGEVTSFERTSGEAGFELYLDGEDVTDELPPDDGNDGGNGEDLPHIDSTFDIQYSQSIESNGDGTTTISGELAPTEPNAGDSYDDIVVVVEIYDDQGEWIASEWDVVGTVGPDRTRYSVTFNVPPDEISDFRADPNLYLANGHEGDEHYNAPGQCVEIQGDGPNDEEPERVDKAIIEYDQRGRNQGTVVAGSIHNGADEHDMAFVRVFVSIYDGSGTRMATRTTLMEDVPQGERQSFAVQFDERGVAEARVDADEMAVRDGQLVCRPPH